MPLVRFTECLCQVNMVVVFESKTFSLYECPSCGRLLVRSKGFGDQNWYVPETELEKFCKGVKVNES